MKLSVSLWLMPLFFGVFTPAGAAQAQPPKVFSARSANTTPPSELRGRGVRRIRAVNFSSSVFSKARAPLRTDMNLFPGIDLIVRWTSVEAVSGPGGVMWKGEVEGHSGRLATLLISGKTLTANIDGGEGISWQIRTTEDGRYWVREVDTRALPRESEPVYPPAKSK